MAKMKRGTYVSRAAFAKMQGERNRLMKDIYTMVMSDNIGKVILLKEEWRKKFNKEKWFWDSLKEIAKTELKDFRKEYPDLVDPKIDSNPKAFR